MLKSFFGAFARRGAEQLSELQADIPQYNELPSLGERKMGDIVAPVEKRSPRLVSDLGLCHVMQRIEKHTFPDPEHTANLKALELGQTLPVSRKNVASTIVYPITSDPLVPVAIPNDTKTVDESQFRKNFKNVGGKYITEPLNGY
jgi:hypothetical protein